MQQIHTARTLADAYIVRDVLQSEGVLASIRNEHLVGVAGDVPIIEGLPSVWVADGDVARARFLMAEYVREDDAAEALGDMDPGADADGIDAQTLLGDIFTTAERLARNPNRGEAVDELRRHAAFVASAAAPFGVEQRSWDRVRRLVTATLAGAESQDVAEVRTRAAELRDAARGLV